MDLENVSFKSYGKQVNFIDDPWFRFYRVINMLDRNVSVPSNSKWLDVGCQIGQFLKLAQSRYGILPYGIDDFDETSVVKICKKHLQLEIVDPSDVLNDSWKYFTRRIDKVGFDLNEKFDFISALEVIEHMVDTDAFLKECRTHIHDDGYLVITTPNINSLRNRIQVPLGAYPNGMEYRTVNHHVRLYNLKKLISHVEEHGFMLIAATGNNFLPRKLIKYKMIRKLDGWFADCLPSFCGGIIALFAAGSITTRSEK